MCRKLISTCPLAFESVLDFSSSEQKIEQNILYLAAYHNGWGKHYVPKVIDKIPLENDSKVFAAFSGTALDETHYILPKVPNGTVDITDFAKPYLAQINPNHKTAKANIYQWNMLNTPIRETMQGHYDVFWEHRGAQHLPPGTEDRFLSNVNLLLKTGGTATFCEPKWHTLKIDDIPHDSPIIKFLQHSTHIVPNPDIMRKLEPRYESHGFVKIDEHQYTVEIRKAATLFNVLGLDRPQIYNVLAKSDISVNQLLKFKETILNFEKDDSLLLSCTIQADIVKKVSLK